MAASGKCIDRAAEVKLMPPDVRSPGGGEELRGPVGLMTSEVASSHQQQQRSRKAPERSRPWTTGPTGRNRSQTITGGSAVSIMMRCSVGKAG